MKCAYVTTICNGDGYVPGVEALGKSLKASGTKIPMVAMTTADVSEKARASLTREGWIIRPVEHIANPNRETQQLFPRFANAYTKLRSWDLAEYDKVVMLDADTIVLQNVDDLFERPDFSAAPDFLLPDRFNSGVMVIEPNAERFHRMIEALSHNPSYDGGDQGFLNTFFPDWYAMPVAHRLPVGYNLFHFIYQFLMGHPSLRDRLEREAKIVHYAVQKPWRAKATLTGGSEAWWNMYFGAHPEKDGELKRRIHHAEDWTFDQFVKILLG